VCDLIIEHNNQIKQALSDLFLGVIAPTHGPTDAPISTKMIAACACAAWARALFHKRLRFDSVSRREMAQPCGFAGDYWRVELSLKLTLAIATEIYAPTILRGVFLPCAAK
jgi:hypothetical protein